MPQMIGLLVLVAALPLLWLALRSDRTPDKTEDGEEMPAWAIAAAQGGAANAVDLHDVVLQMRTIPRLFKPVMERFGIPATVRASFAFYNTLDEVEALARSIERAGEVFR